MERKSNKSTGLSQFSRRILSFFQLRKEKTQLEATGYEDQPIETFEDHRLGFRDYAEVLAKRVVTAELGQW